MQQQQSAQLASNRKKKLSKWVKKIMQPAREAPPTATAAPQHIQENTTTSTHAASTHRRHHSVKPLTEAKTSTTQQQPSQHRESPRVLQWDEEPQRPRERSTVQDVISGPSHHRDEDVDSSDDNNEDSDSDYASMAPLMSFCSSSVKSSTFSDVHSMQSTRPTVMSTRTIETNSSTVAIPPASILDRARATPTVNHSAAASVASSRPPSSKHFSLQRHNSSHTVNSIITIRS